MHDGLLRRHNDGLKFSTKHQYLPFWYLLSRIFRDSGKLRVNQTEGYTNKPNLNLFNQT